MLLADCVSLNTFNAQRFEATALQYLSTLSQHHPSLLSSSPSAEPSSFSTPGTPSPTPAEFAFSFSPEAMCARERFASLQPYRSPLHQVALELGESFDKVFPDADTLRRTLDLFDMPLNFSPTSSQSPSASVDRAQSGGGGGVEGEGEDGAVSSTASLPSAEGVSGWRHLLSLDAQGSLHLVS